MTKIGRKTDLAPVAAAPPPPDATQLLAIEAAVAWEAERKAEVGTAPKFRGTFTKTGDVALSKSHSDTVGFGAQVRHALGTVSFEFADRIVKQLTQAPGVAPTEAVATLNEGLAFIAGYRPQSEVETLILVQAWLTHLALMQAHRRLAQADTMPRLETNGTLTVKLGKLFVQQVESLAKFRAAGKQIIEVQHVHVYPGGSAVVGNITTGGGGGKLPGQSHANADPYLLAVRSEDAIGVPLPIASGPGQAPVSNARRAGRRSEG